MAKKEESSKVVLERTYVIPLRRETLKAPPYRKARKAAKTVRAFIEQHMKSDNVLIGRHLNMKLWEHGMKNPPHHVKVNAVKDDKGKVMVELVGAPKEELKTEEKKPARKEPEKTKEAKPEEKLDNEMEQAHEEKAEGAKKIEKEEIKELKKEQKEHPSKQHAPKQVQKSKFQEQHPTAPRHV